MGTEPTPELEPIPCGNCGTVLRSLYCPTCGQSRRSPVTSMRAFTAHVLDDIANLDSRLLRTLRALFTKPGLLTREYLDGRRVCYTQPIQLYVIAAATFFFAAAFRPFIWVDIESLMIVGALPGLMIGNDVPAAQVAALGTGDAAVQLYAARFTDLVTTWLPVFLIGSVALFSLVQYALQHRRERRYIPHAVFTLHWVAFYLLILAATRLFPAEWRIQDVSPLIAHVYLAIALIRVYGDRPLVAAGKAFVLVMAFLLVLLVWVQAAVSTGMLLV